MKVRTACIYKYVLSMHKTVSFLWDPGRIESTPPKTICHYLVAQSRLTFCHPMDWSPLGLCPWDFGGSKVIRGPNAILESVYHGYMQLNVAVLPFPTVIAFT